MRAPTRKEILDEHYKSMESARVIVIGRGALSEEEEDSFLGAIEATDTVEEIDGFPHNKNKTKFEKIKKDKKDKVK